MGDDLSQFKQLFNDTAAEYFAQIQKSLQTLSQNSSDMAAVEQLFIAAHSLKSQSAVMGFVTTSEASKFLEHMLRAVKDGKLSLTNEYLAQANIVIKQIQASLEQIKNNQQEVDLTQVVADVRRSMPNID